MQTLETLFNRFAKRSNARWWLGQRPNGREVDMGRMIAGRVCYPTATEDPIDADHLIRVNWQQAAHILALAGTTSLVYGRRLPPDEQIEAAKQALKDMTGDATFLSNGLWNSFDGAHWSPLTTATFDCGVIGFDSKNAFIFWVEEED
jgi:hypothetical protein